MKAFMELPVARDGFAGIVGSRIEIMRGNGVLIQIAYLEKGEVARVRYTEMRLKLEMEKPAQAFELKLADVQIMGGDTKTTKLEVDIVYEADKQRTAAKG